MSKKIVIAGGGTGGHIYPGIAIAKALLKADPTLQISFVGTSAGLETKIVPKEGFPLHLIEVGKLNLDGNRVQRILTLLKLPLSFFSALKLLFKIKPNYVLGVGGYASGPFVLVASIFGFKTAVWEPNAFPGMTNRWLSRFTKTSFVVFDSAKKYLHSKTIKQLGLPIRQEVEELSLHQNRNVVLPLKKLHSKTDKFHVLIFGGSQGARAINKVVTEMLVENSEFEFEVEFIHQTGVHDFASTFPKYEKILNVEALEYLHNMELFYQWADLVICRSGASTVAELAAARKPAIFIPLPWAADDHQRKNAAALVDQQASFMLLQNELTVKALREMIIKIKADAKSIETAKLALQKFHNPKSAESLAAEILKEVL